MFDIQEPENAKIDDRITGIGLPQGDMTDSQAAAEVVRRYIQAKIEGDYVKAASLYNGQSAEDLRQHDQRAKIKYVRLIAIGEPVPKPERHPRTFAVPFAFEIETADGKRHIAGPFGGLPSDPNTEAALDLTKCRQAMVRPVVGKPDLWVITGGI